MSNIESNTTLETLQQKHKKERKELQNKIQSLKKSCSKGDKTKKKQITEEIVRLEAELDKRHSDELQQVTPNDEVTSAINSLHISTESSDEQDNISQEQQKLTKAQRRRNKKSEKEKEREILIAQQEQENKFGPRHLEQIKIVERLKEKNLILHEIPSDGNCMYAAISQQLVNANDVFHLRSLAANYLRTHADEFRPFTSNHDTGLELNKIEFEQYCQKTEKDSSAWGGHLELQALAQVLQRPIEVIQADGANILLGEQYKPAKPIILTFHRHAFGLGEHYNSVKPKPEQQED